MGWWGRRGGGGGVGVVGREGGVGVGRGRQITIITATPLSRLLFQQQRA